MKFKVDFNMCFVGKFIFYLRIAASAARSGDISKDKEDFAPQLPSYGSKLCHFFFRLLKIITEVTTKVEFRAIT